jgi:hypothetical protein
MGKNGAGPHENRRCRASHSQFKCLKPLITQPRTGKASVIPHAGEGSLRVAQAKEHVSLKKNLSSKEMFHRMHPRPAAGSDALPAAA